MSIYNKNGQAIIKLAKFFLALDADERIPTISVFEKELDVARGTVQIALETLKSNKAITTVSKGHMGSYLLKKDIYKLLEFADISFVIGVMPLPYSKKYEGLATGLKTVLDNQFGLRINLAYMSGSNSRIDMIESGRYDFSIVSKYTAELAISNNKAIKIIQSFGEHSYLSGHCIVFAKDIEPVLRDNLTLGIDMNSLDQEQLTYKVVNGYKVKLEKLNYNQIMEKISTKEIDAAVWNIDEIVERYPDFKYLPIDVDNNADSEAVVITSLERPEIGVLLSQLIDINEVINIQDKVVSKQMLPVY